MIAYYDTGAFIDYLIGRSHAGTVLRTTSRRNRDPETLSADAEECLQTIKKLHRGVISCHTLYEVENAMYSSLKALAKGNQNSAELLLYSARPIISQVIMVADIFGIEIKDLTKDFLRDAAEDALFLRESVKLSDTLHMKMAMSIGAELIISSDNHVLSFDKKLYNMSGLRIRCLDTDDARLIL